MQKDLAIEVIEKTAAKCNTPSRILEAVIWRLLPSIRLLPQVPEHESESSPGRSRIGGLPDLPAGMPWPRSQKGSPEEMRAGDPPFSFVMQVDCGHVGRFDLQNLLPQTGILYFFYRISYTADEWYGDDSRVVYVQHVKSDLRPAETPPDLGRHELYRGFELVPRLEWTVPNPDDLGLKTEFVHEHLELWDTLEERVQEIQGFGPWYAPKHRLLGHPQLLQPFGVGDREALLLQVGSDCVFDDKGFPSTGMMWGDAGRIYYYMLKEDLQSHNFNAASACLDTQ